jgi:hypothetical protein
MLRPEERSRILLFLKSRPAGVSTTEVKTYVYTRRAPSREIFDYLMSLAAEGMASTREEPRKNYSGRTIRIFTATPRLLDQLAPDRLGARMGARR